MSETCLTPAQIYESEYNTALARLGPGSRDRVLAAKGDDANRDPLVRQFVRDVIKAAESRMDAPAPEPAPQADTPQTPPV